MFVWEEQLPFLLLTTPQSLLKEEPHRAMSQSGALSRTQADLQCCMCCMRSGGFVRAFMIVCCVDRDISLIVLEEIFVTLLCT